MSLPNLIIAGVNKAGTTSLHNYLADHPEVCGSDVKETFFWNRLKDWNAVDLDRYRKHFRHAKTESVLLESTPRYFHDVSSKVAEIDTMLGKDVKIILVLREPVSRAFSFFKYKKAGFEINKEWSFDEYVTRCLEATEAEKAQSDGILQGVEDSLYVEDYRVWKQQFGDRLRVIFNDDLKSAKQTCSDLAKWLGIDAGFYDTYGFPRENRSVNYKFKWVHSLGIYVFRGLNQLWGRMPGVRRFITRMYYKINGQEFDEVVDDATRTKLTEYYRSDMTSLCVELKAEGLEVPGWLSSYSER